MIQCYKLIVSAPQLKDTGLFSNNQLSKKKTM